MEWTLKRTRYENIVGLTDEELDAEALIEIFDEKGELVANNKQYYPEAISSFNAELIVAAVNEYRKNRGL